MSIYAQTRNKKLLENIGANSVSDPVFTADFKTQEFTLTVIAELVYQTLVGAFQVGETITGGTSGATAVITADTPITATTGTLQLSTIVGVFVAGETITGGTSAATAVVSAGGVDVPDFDIEVLESNEQNPPDLSLPPAPGNSYSDVDYLDKQGNASYNALSPYNPNADVLTPGALSKTFQVQSNGSRWQFVKISTYVAGKVSEVLFSTFSN